MTEATTELANETLAGAVIAPQLERGPTGLTLRAKALIAVGALVAYSLVVGMFMAHERYKMGHIFDQLAALRHEQAFYTATDMALVHASAALDAVLEADRFAPSWPDIALDIRAYSPGLVRLGERSPRLQAEVRELQQALAALDTDPSRATVVAVRDHEKRVSQLAEEEIGVIDSTRRRLAQQHATLNGRLTYYITGFNALGLVAFGIAGTLFFTRCARDLRRLQDRALAVAAGYRGPPLSITRTDEVGLMMSAVNQLQRELALRERQQEMSRQQRFHQEKMAAIGSLVSTVAHEVGNPINSISGIAQHTIDTIRAGHREGDDAACRNAELTVRQAERVAAILRDLSDISAPRSAKPELLDVNDLVRATCSFIRYDKRFRGIDLALELGPRLPAVRAVADHLTQVLMNLLINSADAIERDGGHPPQIRVATRQEGGCLVLTVRDNGNGMERDVLARAFEQDFTTKPAGKGRGIGLYLCKTLMEGMGGHIRLESIPGQGTVARLDLPCRADIVRAA